MKLTNAPEALRPYLFHRVGLKWDDKKATGDCPFCDHERFGIRVDNGLFKCFRCGAKGNALEFVRRLWKESDEKTTDYKELQDNRGLLYPSTLVQWEVGRSILDGCWLVAGRDYQNRVCQLYRYTDTGTKRLLLATPTMRHGMFGRQLYDPSCSTVYICEGPWDAMALWEVLQEAKDTNEGLRRTGNRQLSLGGSSSVLAVPGANVFRAEWAALLADRDVVLCFDNDHPKERKGKTIPPAGWEGVRRIGGILGSAKRKPGGVRYLRWGGEHYIRWGGEGYNLSLPDGYDIRDSLVGALRDRLGALEGLLGKVYPLEPEAVSKPSRAPSQELAPTPCKSYKDLISAWRKALKWSEGLDHALATMLASIASVKTVGDQLWVKILAPPSTGKTLLCEAVSTNRKYVIPVSTFRGFHSGYREAGDDGKDHGLLGKLYDMTMVMKDGDTLLQTPNLTQILSEGRDLYDGASRSHYRNARGKDHENIRMTWILCGTAALRQIDSSELGERFLDCVIMDEIDPVMEDAILWRAANRASEAVATATDGQASAKYDKDIIEAMRLTGGYIDWLKDYGPELMPRIEASDDALRQCVRLGKFIAYMRARPSLRQIETAEREMAARLVSQLVRLAKCLALILNREAVDSVVVGRVRRVALDTGRGRVLDIVSHLATSEDGMEVQSIAMLTNQTDGQARSLLRFMRQLKMVGTFTKKLAPGIKGRSRWRLTGEIAELWAEVMED